VVLIAVNAAAIEIGVAFLVAIAGAAVAFLVHTRVLEHRVERRQTELRAHWAQTSAPVMADRPRRPRLEIVPDQERWVQVRRADASDDQAAHGSPAPRKAVG